MLFVKISDRKKICFSNLCVQPLQWFFPSFIYSASIHFKPLFQLLKGYFLHKWDIWLKRIKHKPLQRKITTTKDGSIFFFKNWQEQLMWQELIMSSCNKTFKQVISLFSKLTSALFIPRIALYTYLKFEASFWISKNVASGFFG